MKRISLILAVAMFGISVGGAAAQTPPEGKTPDVGRQAVNPTEETRSQASLEKPEPPSSMEWLDGPPGISRQVAAFSVVANPEQTHCATALGSAMNACLIAFGRCFSEKGTSFEGFIECADASILCIEAAEAAFDACLDEND